MRTKIAHYFLHRTRGRSTLAESLRPSEPSTIESDTGTLPAPAPIYGKASELGAAHHPCPIPAQPLLRLCCPSVGSNLRRAYTFDSQKTSLQIS